MFEIDRDEKKIADQYLQNLSDKEFEFFVFQLMMAFEIQKHTESLFKNYDFVSKLDNLLFEIEKDLLNQMENIDVHQRK
jgi:hypothetical protein